MPHPTPSVGEAFENRLSQMKSWRKILSQCELLHATATCFFVPVASFENSTRVSVTSFAVACPARASETQFEKFAAFMVILDLNGQGLCFERAGS
jgi:hypothetical protein